MPNRNPSTFCFPFVLALSAAAISLSLVATGCDSAGDSSKAPYGAPAASAAPVAAPPDAPQTAPATGDAKMAPPSLPAGGAPGATGGAAPMMGMGGDPTAPLTPTPEMDVAITKAEASKDAKAIAKAYADRGTFRMNDGKAGARVKYRAALDDYRKALAADPANAEAKNNKDMIENIYRSMNRPIPGADGK